MKIKSKNLVLSILTTAAIFSFANKTYAEDSVVFERISGVDRFETSRNIAQSTYKTADTAIIVNGSSYSDSISATGLSKKYNAPIVLNEKDNVNNETLALLKSLNTENVIIIGDETAISENAENKLRDNGYSIERYAGDSRYDTSMVINEDLLDKSSVDEIIIVSGDSFADSISISSYAHNNDVPIFVTPKDAPQDMINKIKSFNPGKVFVVGGKTVIGDWVENNFDTAERIAGANRYETSRKVHDKFFKDSSKEVLYTTKGDSFPDSIAGVPLASNNDANIVLSDKSAQEVTDLNPDKVVIFGERLPIEYNPLNGWVDGKYYRNDALVTGLQNIDGKTYLFDAQGNNIKKNTNIDGKWYIFDSKGNYVGKGKKYTSNASAYSGGTQTASGEKARWGTIATDPKVIPMFSNVYVPYFDKTFRSNDTGGAIKGTKIDVFMNSSKECRQFGRRNIEIFVLDKN